MKLLYTMYVFINKNKNKSFFFSARGVYHYSLKDNGSFKGVNRSFISMIKAERHQHGNLTLCLFMSCWTSPRTGYATCQSIHLILGANIGANISPVKKCLLVSRLSCGRRGLEELHMQDQGRNTQILLPYFLCQGNCLFACYVFHVVLC